MANNRVLQRIGRFLSFAAFYTTLLVYSPNVVVLQPFDSGALTGYFAEPYLMCATVSALVLSLLAWHGRNVDDGVLLSRRCMLSALLLYVLSNVLFVLTLYGAPAFGAALSTACALVAGISLAPVCVAWSRAFADLDLRRAVAGVALCALVSAAFTALLSAVPPPASLALFVVLLVAGVAWPLLGAFGKGACPFVGVASPDIVEQFHELDGQAHGGDRLGPFFSIMGVPLVGTAIAAFVMGVQPMFLFDAGVDAQRIGMVLGAFALLPIAALGKRQPVYSFIYQVYVPSAAAFVLLLCVMPVTGWLFEAVLAVTHAFYCMVIGVAVAAACAIANAREFSRTFVFSTLIFTFCGTGILGIFLGARIEVLFHNNATVLMVLTAFYACGMFLWVCVKSWRFVARPLEHGVPAGDSHAEALPKVQTTETFEARLSRLSSHAALSPRETEIVGYVGRGHSSVYVAKTLLISESTVYSHVRNIYRKLGISSREELIRLLNEPLD